MSRPFEYKAVTRDNPVGREVTRELTTRNLGYGAVAVLLVVGVSLSMWLLLLPI